MQLKINHQKLTAIEKANQRKTFKHIGSAKPEHLHRLLPEEWKD